MPSHVHIQHGPFPLDLGFYPKGERGPSYPTVISSWGGLRSTPMVVPSLMPSRHVRIVPAVEAVRLLRRECGAGQIADCETAIGHGNGGVLSPQSTVILGTQAASCTNINGFEILATPNPVWRLQTVLLDKSFISLPRRYASIGIGAQEGASPYWLASGWCFGDRTIPLASVHYRYYDF